MRTLLLTLGLAVLTLPAVAGSPFVGSDHDDATSDVAWLYESPLTVYESINYAGDGHWAYRYTFENVDADAIWMFGLFTNFGIIDILSSWDSTPNWFLEGGEIQYVFDAYDGRNLDPDITFIAGTYAPGFDDTGVPIPPGETVLGFTFIGEVLDDSPKWYCYETVESGYAGETGFVAAVGLTQGPPVAVGGRTLAGVRALFD